MHEDSFLRIEREERDGSRHYVVHPQDPRFAMELAPATAAPDKVGRGVIRRVRVPNSWAGDYDQYAQLMTAAQDFFTRSFAEPVPKPEARGPPHGAVKSNRRWRLVRV